MILTEDEMEEVVGMMQHNAFKILIRYLQAEEDAEFERMLNRRSEETMREKAAYIKGIRSVAKFFKMCKTQISEHSA